MNWLPFAQLDFQESLCLFVAGSGNPQLQFACRKAAIRFRSTREI